MTGRRQSGLSSLHECPLQVESRHFVRVFVARRQVGYTPSPQQSPTPAVSPTFPHSPRNPGTGIGLQSRAYCISRSESANPDWPCPSPKLSAIKFLVPICGGRHIHYANSRPYPYQYCPSISSGNYEFSTCAINYMLLFETRSTKC